MYAEKVDSTSQKGLTQKYCNSLKGDSENNSFVDLVRGMGFEQMHKREEKGEVFTFDLSQFADLGVSQSQCMKVKLKIFKSYELGQELKILDEIFEDEALSQFDFYQVELTSICCDNELAAYCHAVVAFSKKFTSFVELGPVTPEINKVTSTID